jgi:hypothetical protein
MTIQGRRMPHGDEVRSLTLQYGHYALLKGGAEPGADGSLAAPVPAVLL